MITKKGKRWYVVIEGGRDEQGKRIRHWHPAGERKKDAEALERRLKADQEEDRYLSPTSLIVGDYLLQYLEEVARPSIRFSTYRWYEEIVRLHLTPSLGRVPLKGLEPIAIQSLYTMLHRKKEEGGKGLAPRTVRSIHRFLRQALGHAVQLRLIAHNPTEGLKTPRVEIRSGVALPVDKIHKLLDAINDRRVLFATEIAIGTGFRIGEICALSWDDYNAARETLTVRRSVRFHSGTAQFGPPKTKMSARTVRLPRFLTQRLQKEKEEQEKRKTRNPDYQENQLILCETDGRPINPTYLSCLFSRTTRKVGLAEVRFHDLRRTHITHLVRGGFDPKSVMGRAGHSDVRMTLEIYTEADPEAEAPMAAYLDGLLGHDPRDLPGRKMVEGGS